MRQALSESPRVQRALPSVSRLVFWGLGLAGALSVAVPALGAPSAAESSVTTASIGAEGTNVDVDANTSAPGDDSRQSSQGLPFEGFEYGLRLGLELPIGSIDGGASVFGGAIRTRDGALDGVSSFGVPIALDLGYRTSDYWWWGVTAGAGTGPVGSDCPEGANCEWASLRLGAQVMHAFQPPSGSTIPWLGLALGYESLRGSVSQALTLSPEADAATVAVKAREYLGGPFLSLQGGLDFTVLEHLRVGPYATGVLGSYLRDEYECPSALLCPEGTSADDPRLHAWFGLGVRGSNGP